MKDLSIDDYNYELSTERIAAYPLPERDLSKLLIYQNGGIQEDVYRNLASYLPGGSLVVFNNSRVIEARLVFSKPSGGKIEIFCLEPAPGYNGIQHALGQTGEVRWLCLIGGASKWKPGQVLELTFPYENKEVMLRAYYESKINEAFTIRFSWDNEGLSFAEVLHLTGSMPLPPYIKRPAEQSDKTRYQTIYAEEAGSVAAPTAGLHFTPAIMASLKARNIESLFVTLHVGAGTFKPVKANKMADHEMHAEVIDVDLPTLRQLISHHPKHITAVGTTSIRTIESLYWMGVQILQSPGLQASKLSIGQWFADDNNDCSVSSTDALLALQSWMVLQGMNRLITKTQLLIGPGYHFRIADALVTNFHQPKSTLLLLVAAMAGPGWKSIYDYALSHEFRFLSYGDGSLIFNSQPGREKRR